MVAHGATCSGSPRSPPTTSNLPTSGGGYASEPIDTSGWSPSTIAHGSARPFASARRWYSNMRRRECRLTPMRFATLELEAMVALGLHAGVGIARDQHARREVAAGVAGEVERHGQRRPDRASRPVSTRWPNGGSGTTTGLTCSLMRRAYSGGERALVDTEGERERPRGSPRRCRRSGCRSRRPVRRRESGSGGAARTRGRAPSRPLRSRPARSRGSPRRGGPARRRRRSSGGPGRPWPRSYPGRGQKWKWAPMPK